MLRPFAIATSYCRVDRVGAATRVSMARAPGIPETARRKAVRNQESDPDDHLGCHLVAAGPVALSTDPLGDRLGLVGRWPRSLDRRCGRSPGRRQSALLVDRLRSTRRSFDRATKVPPMRRGLRRLTPRSTWLPDGAR